MDKYNDRYLGPKQIKLTQPAGETRRGVPLVKVTFNDNTSEILSSLMLDSEGIVTNGPQDLSTLRSVRLYPLVTKMIQLMHDYNLKINEVQPLQTLIITSINMNIDTASKFLWKMDEELDERTLVQVDSVMAQIQPTLKDVIS